MKYLRVLLFSTLLPLLLMACGEKPEVKDRLVTDPPPGTVAVRGLAVEPAHARLARGMPLDLRALALLSDGNVLDVTASPHLSWRSSDEGIATLDAGGRVVAHATGEVTVTADFYNRSAGASLILTDATPRVLDIDPGDTTLPAGTVTRLRVKAGLSDGSHQALGAAVTWQSLNPDVAVIDANGWLRALRPGVARVAARLETAAGQWYIGIARVEVVASTLQSIEIGPPDPLLVAGILQPLTATGVFGDAAGNILRHDLTPQVQWASSDETLAVVGNGTSLPRGWLQAVTPGEVTVTAVTGTVSGEAVLRIADTMLESLRIAAPDTNPASGAELGLVLVAEYNDGSSREVTEQALWGSGDPLLATVSNLPGQRGRVVVGASAGGPVRIQATHGGQRAEIILHVAHQPQRPLALTAWAEPDFMLADGSDAVTLRVQLLAADQAVPDGTAVELEVRDAHGAVVLPATTRNTVDGAVYLAFRTSAPGLLRLHARHAGTGLAQSTLLVADSHLASAVSILGRRDTIVEAGQLLAGGSFEAAVTNVSSRDFRLQRIQFCHGAADPAACQDATLTDITFAAGEWLRGGEQRVFEHILASDIADAPVFFLVHLEDPATSQTFFQRLDYP